MQLQQANGALAAAWILAAGLIGLVGNVTSIGGGLMVLGFGLVPPILMMLRWSDPPQAVPERVHHAQR
jgi:hypothetical protein